LSHEQVDLLLKAAGATAVAVVTAWWFLFRRSLEPGCELQIDAHFAGRQSNRILLEVVASLTNKSSVRQNYRDFRVSVRYLCASDAVVDGPNEIAFQINFPHSIDTSASGNRFFSNVAYIDPSVTFRHSYVTGIPEDATFVLVQCRLLFKCLCENSSLAREMPGKIEFSHRL
jgi:hypothetical protein